MLVFEFHFNPKLKEDSVFDSFIYEPENEYEKNLGSLYIVGELTNALPKEKKFLNQLSSKIKDGYYRISGKSTQESSFRNSLKEANNFLEEQQRQGNIDWLGNINISAITLKDFNFSFTKTGEIKILLCRNNEITNIGEQLKENGSSSLKTFSNIVSGKLAPEDKIIILTKQSFDLFQKEDLLSDILSSFEKCEKPKDKDKTIKKILNKKRDLLSEISGIFVLISLEENKNQTVKMKEPLSLKKSLPAKLPSLSLLPKIKKITKIGKFIPKIPTRRIIPSFKKGVPIKISIKKILSPVSSLENLKTKQIIALIATFIIILSLGNYIFKVQRQKEIERVNATIDQTKEKMARAENALIYGNERECNLLYQEAWNDLLILLEEKIPEKEKVISLKDSIEEELFKLNNIESNPSLELIIEINKSEFEPKNFVFSQSEFYLSNPQSNLVHFSKQDKLQLPGKVLLSEKFQDIALFLLESNEIIFVKNKEITSIKELINPYPEAKFKDISSFGPNLYLLDSENREIIKYALGTENSLEGELWLQKEAKKPLDPQSIAVDGSIWVMSKDNNILRYYRGELQEEIEIDIFPKAEGESKLITNSELSNLYLLTPEQNRIAILSKEGKIIKQFKFNDLNSMKDLSVSEKEDLIYILDSYSLYKLSI